MEFTEAKKGLVSGLYSYIYRDDRCWDSGFIEFANQRLLMVGVIGRTELSLEDLDSIDWVGTNWL